MKLHSGGLIIGAATNSVEGSRRKNIKGTAWYHQKIVISGHIEIG